MDWRLVLLLFLAAAWLGGAVTLLLVGTRPNIDWDTPLEAGPDEVDDD